MMIAETVAVDVPGPGDRATAEVARVDPIEAEAVGAVEVGERGGRHVDRRRHHDRAEADHDVVEVEVPQVLEAEQQRPARGISARDHPLGAARVEVVLEPVGIVASAVWKTGPCTVRTLPSSATWRSAISAASSATFAGPPVAVLTNSRRPLPSNTKPGLRSAPSATTNRPNCCPGSRSAAG